MGANLAPGLPTSHNRGAQQLGGHAPPGARSSRSSGRLCSCQVSRASPSRCRIHLHNKFLCKQLAGLLSSSGKMFNKYILGSQPGCYLCLRLTESRSLFSWEHGCKIAGSFLFSQGNEERRWP